ncbi:putative E3 ubiquitin-protein ligase BAH1-like 1 isoform X1 [Cucumis melo var. makuwa]|uniref:RING-type E3 ubiquitin transferase n=2 Tax=Cucumis melo TaxID=3656 RepID=A0A1S3BSY3_CUCME|nr:probable E3 ubiquitin-protein ligase BAH1-like 1 isoform X1 [Cucumis melo]KAA0067999.1 putative E3 ubiquitin-protein ligase BAH1-like 1 isoform X1 [Cucumis melo var. makuwa]TYK18128.1 putative E3 ubiquitin-protein ligase BAH1-like 1 isoform X1 [Cucumis melo var. makuwa]
MKFCKKYEEYLRGQEKKLKLPGFHFKRLKKILKNCSRDFQSRHRHGDGACYAVAIHSCPDQCSVCDGTFFPFLLNEMSAIVGGFNQRAQKLLELHLASGFRKYLLWFKGKLESDHAVLVQEGKELVNYALMNAIAVRKILKKYDKIHYSKQGQTFKSQAQSKHIEILQSPWLSELIAFHINLKETKHKSKRISSAFEECSLAITDGKPSLTCELFDSVKLDIDLTCSICLEIVFDPVSLTCGHIFCYMCACSAASVTIVDGLKSANPKAKCPLCREARVYEGAVHLEELNILLSRSCPEYWEKRLQTERAERVQQAKEHWESISRAFMGM